MSVGLHDDAAEFLAELQGQVALIGIDLGTKTVGLAVSDSGWRVATPLKTLKRGKLKDVVASLSVEIADRTVGGIVIGLPRNMDGSEGPRAQSTRAFARNLVQQLNVPLCFWDERLSTVAAERALLEADTSRRKRADVIDHVAASYILQGALDRLNTLRGNAHVG